MRCGGYACCGWAAIWNENRTPKIRNFLRIDYAEIHHNYADITNRLRRHYAKITQSLRKDYVTQKLHSRTQRLRRRLRRRTLRKDYAAARHESAGEACPRQTHKVLGHAAKPVAIEKLAFLPSIRYEDGRRRGGDSSPGPGEKGLEPVDIDDRAAAHLAWQRERVGVGARAGRHREGAIPQRQAGDPVHPDHPAATRR